MNRSLSLSRTQSENENAARWSAVPLEKSTAAGMHVCLRVDVSFAWRAVSHSTDSVQHVVKQSLTSENSISLTLIIVDSSVGSRSNRPRTIRPFFFRSFCGSHLYLYSCFVSFHSFSLPRIILETSARRVVSVMLLHLSIREAGLLLLCPKLTHNYSTALTTTNPNTQDDITFVVSERG